MGNYQCKQSRLPIRAEVSTWPPLRVQAEYPGGWRGDGRPAIQLFHSVISLSSSKFGLRLQKRQLHIETSCFFSPSEPHYRNELTWGLSRSEHTHHRSNKPTLVCKMLNYILLLLVKHKVLAPQPARYCNNVIKSAAVSLSEGECLYFKNSHVIAAPKGRSGQPVPENMTLGNLTVDWFVSSLGCKINWTINGADDRELCHQKDVFILVHICWQI